MYRKASIALLFMLIILLVPDLLVANVESTPLGKGEVPPSDAFFTTMQVTFSHLMNPWKSYIRPIANNLLYSLTAIQIVLVGMKLLTDDGIEMPHLLGEVVKVIMIAGFLYWLINTDYTSVAGTSEPILRQILEGFIHIAKNVDPVLRGEGGFNLDNITGYMYNLQKHNQTAMEKVSGMFAGFASAIIMFISLLAVTRASMAALKNYVYAVFTIHLVPIILAAAVLEYSRAWALSSITLVIKYSMKFLALSLVIYLVFDLLKYMIDKGSSMDSAILITFVLSMLMLELVNGAEGIVEGIFSGSHQSKGNMVAGGKA